MFANCSIKISNILFLQSLSLNGVLSANLTLKTADGESAENERTVQDGARLRN